MEMIKELARNIYREEKGKHEKPYQALSAIGHRLFDEYGIKGIETNNRFIYVCNAIVFDIKEV
jgi:hypothetical protein